MSDVPVKTVEKEDRGLAAYDKEYRMGNPHASEQNSSGYSDIKYTTTFLDQVILRLDLVSPEESLEKRFPTAVQKALFAAFPISEPSEALGGELQFSNIGRPSAKKITKKEWVFYTENRDTALKIISEALILTYGRYDSHNQLMDDVRGVLDAYTSHFSGTQFRRIGLRFINTIRLDEVGRVEWGKYIEPSLLGALIFRIGNSKSSLRRYIGVLEATAGTHRIRVQFGIPNPDFPAEIKRDEFLLDLDAFSTGIFEWGDVVPTVKLLHSTIQSTFESAIRDELRVIMR